MKLNGRNKITAINAWAVSIMRYGAGVLKWNTDELKSLDRRTRKFMTMHEVLHPKGDVDRVYLSREMGGRRLRNCEGCIRREENNMWWFVRNSVELLIKSEKLQKQQNITIQWIRRNSNRVGWGKRRNYWKTKECMDSL